MAHIHRRAVLRSGALAIFVGLSPSVYAQTAFDQDTSELAWVLAGLSQLDLGGDSVNRESDCWSAVETWFAPFVDHAAIKSLGSDFNLPRLIGNAANYRFSSEGRLTLIPNSRPLWDDPKGDLFTRNLDHIQDFVNKSRAIIFLSHQTPTLERLRAATYRSFDVVDMQAWLEHHFKARPGTMQVYVSPVTKGWNFTNLDPVTPRLWVPALKVATDEAQRFRAVRAIFTEVDHNYINPATERLPKEKYQFLDHNLAWASLEVRRDYKTSALILNEYMTWAAFLAYARDRTSVADYEAIYTNTLQVMLRRGFLRFAEFSMILLDHLKSGSDGLENSYSSMLEAARSVR